MSNTIDTAPDYKRILSDLVMSAFIADHLGDLEIGTVIHDMGIPDLEAGDDWDLHKAAAALALAGYDLPAWYDPQDMENGDE
jgi:hypothetical protein